MGRPGGPVAVMVPYTSQLLPACPLVRRAAMVVSREATGAGEVEPCEASSATRHGDAVRAGGDDGARAGAKGGPFAFQSARKFTAR